MPYNLLLYFLKLLSFLGAAASALPLLIALGLIIGRRGNAKFVINGSKKLTPLAIWLACVGIFYFPISYLSVVLPYGLKKSVLTAILLPEGRPWLVASIIWLVGIVILFLACGIFKRMKSVKNDNKYSFRYIRTPFFLFILASLCFLISYFFENWPFAGLPESLSMENAALAIGQHTMRRFFAAFSPAGAVSLLFLSWLVAQGRLNDFKTEKLASLRWFSFWSCAGAIPSLFTSLSLQLAAWINPPILTSASINNKILLLGLIFQCLAVALWVWIIIRPHRSLWRIPVAFILTLLKEFWPLLTRNAI